ncbi:probable tRNA (uracil-O(2)-)-methyltransferase [Microplitis demolitor]|uniref:probable tRNA (uracil-O(2)-)-methyltransferase n=1 Tax=Microplitis demolitor TaxID=69319 RepID=UPI0004CCD50C|nr:probable tRNA (uracil-O(2)-)-methyltransferase [Microplitis demolitor]XP_053593836.1 probable tRNA (uracil-O(2)-)-methyltransferase [Microplitis demolitor]XP_053593837.1 probable tRNA (uracil-O(2)-)-methyltransferase [Microplitis demolitor]XP_053593838.1 probable tRNA (uracil-O(2)-)-methyltransferase [Microplitis demolitor]
MNYQVLISKESDLTSNKFWKGIEILLNNSHLINKRIVSSTTILKIELTNIDIDSVVDHITNITDISQLFEYDLNKNFNIINNYDFVTLSEDFNIFYEDNEPDVDAHKIYLIIKKLLPRENEKFSQTIEFDIVDKNNKTIVCFTKQLDDNRKSVGLDWPYKIINNNRQVSLLIPTKYYDNKSSDPSIDWLKTKLFGSLIKWMKYDDKQKKSFVQGSLNLISTEKYCYLYTDLKKKYGIDLVKKWPECTDPLKFVYEDIAIASYLIILWEQERNEKGIDKKQSFIDLGCGNGLLAYILTNEGHPGRGVDLRRRKIWDLFIETTELEEKTLIPSSESLFPDTDWLIGNHSDELTPWIPVMAARSSYNCRFFLLPCCAHEFDGRKYQRSCAGNSQYLEYLEYVKSICETCGFITRVDRLRIPSTKRVCLIGWLRNYHEPEIEVINKRIEEIINARAIEKINVNNNDDNVTDKWSNNFKPRDIVEKVKNCTKIDKNIINEIVNLVANHLLQKVRIVNVNSDDNNSEECKWNAGGKIELNEVAKLIPAGTLKQLKTECGGLQTLLKNNSHIFQVINGTVQFKIPGSNYLVSKKRKNKSNVRLKVKPCWFFFNHPNGCPLSDNKCTFKH